MEIVGILRSVEASSLATWIRDSLYAFPLIESFHVIGLTMVFGTIAVVDLRLLGLASTRRPFSTLALETLKWTWVAFGLTVSTGVLMFSTNPVAYYQNLAFRFKMTLLLLAGINVLLFNRTAGRTVDRWNRQRAAPFAGKLAAALSLLLWIGVIFLGRWVGFTKATDVTPDTDSLINLERFQP
jgi:uncharacterized protein DUF6644